MLMEFTSGLPETRCGLGSTLRFTEGLRLALPALFQRLGVRTIVDAPCGDFNWLSRTDLSMVGYTGIDYDTEHLLKATRFSEPEHFAPWKKILLPLDLVVSALPLADLILCRDFFQHLPNDMIHQVLYNFKRSGAQWLLATNHEQWDTSDIARMGDFHPVNLTLAPFHLPQPVERLVDGPRRTLALWRMDQIA